MWLRLERPRDGSRDSAVRGGPELGRKLSFLRWQGHGFVLRDPSGENVTCEEKTELLVLSVKAGGLSLGPLGA